MDILGDLDSSVMRQGVKLEARDWLDMGSEGWRKTSEKEKALAYQAAKITGWTDKGLHEIMTTQFGTRVDEFQAELTLSLLKEYEEKHPQEHEILDKQEHTDTWKIRSSETKFPFPK